MGGRRRAGELVAVFQAGQGAMTVSLVYILAGTIPYLKALIDDAASLSSFFTGGVPVRLLAALSSLPRTRLPPGPRFLRPLLLREPSMLDGPNDMGWLVFRLVLNRRRSSVPTLLEAKSGGGWGAPKPPEKLRASPRPIGARPPPLEACCRTFSISASC